MYDNYYPSNYENLIVGADTTVPLRNGRLVTAINFDNAATTPPFCAVMQEIMNFSPWYSSIHRGTGYKSQLSSHFYENARKTVGEFVNADLSKDTVIFVKNTTEAINKVAHSLSSTDEQPVVLSTCMEHHSNDLPWRRNYRVGYIDIDEDGRLNIEDLKYKLEKYNGSVKLVVVTGASNVTGHKNPIYEIATLVHQYNCKILVDGAQLVPHSPVEMKPHSSPQHIDYLVFSGHKMYAPFGIGVLVAPQTSFSTNPPDLVGGGTVDLVTHNQILWADVPQREEAGTPNVFGVVALIAAIKTLSQLDMKKIEYHEYRLMEYALMRMRQVPEVELYGDCIHLKNRVSIVPFNIKGISHDLTAKILSMEGGIAVRNGCFCAQPYVQKLLGIPDEKLQEHIQHPELPRPGMVRISFGLYNQIHEIDKLIALLWTITSNKQYYIDLYKDSPNFF
ncbi:aminotransferase class V-fold PLP-dependent enzyme [Alkaliphilus hydrothermalis]|uniref:Selenocysteine lyase/cysteine desulfurase n=1 Tax=Alkaliphilus hydrothermalis TaxID=1482730 RepID=A0ABS2NQ95_9FIRM|nr:aminotransferase class V-fold PLP-dependent enzyme [Alkaliphilus hydrothermalis]MBM7614972.1 selenocysteine lyase/cysteine desulfurase [Alkaliphilus hydrothermalis]